MTRRIDPDLFARLMKLSSGTRSDLLEYLGQTPVSPSTVARLPALLQQMQCDSARTSPEKHG